MLRNIFCWKGFGPVTGPPSFPGANFQQMVIARLSLGLSFLGLRNFLKLCHDEKPCTWWLGEKGLGSLQSRLARMLHHEYDALKGYRFLGGGHIVLQRFVHVRCHFQPLPTKLVFAYFDRGSYRYTAEVFDCNESWLLAHLRPDFLKPCIAHRRSHLDRDSTGHHPASPIITLIFPHSIWFDLIRYHYDIWVELVLKTFGWTGMVWDWMDQDQHIEIAKDASERAPLMVRCTSALSWAACDGCLLLFVYSLIVLNLFFTMSRYFKIRQLLPLLHHANYVSTTYSTPPLFSSPTSTIPALFRTCKICFRSFVNAGRSDKSLGTGNSDNHFT